MVSLADAKRLKEQQGIAPPKRSLLGYAWLPFSYAGDFIKGTVMGASRGINRWASRGVKIGAVIAIGTFFMPTLPAVAGAYLASWGLPAVGGMVAALPSVEVGLEAVMGTLVYALGGGVVGGLGGVAVGAATGGAKEIELRYRREKYAEDLAERGKMVRIQQQMGRTVPHWREYSRAHRVYRNEVDFRQFEVQREQERDATGQSWVDRVMSGRSGYGGRGF